MTCWDFAHQNPWWALVYLCIVAAVVYDVGMGAIGHWRRRKP